MKKIIKFFKGFYFWPRVALILIIVFLLIGLFQGAKWLISAAYADSLKYGYCLVEDESLWKKINVVKEITDVKS